MEGGGVGVPRWSSEQFLGEGTVGELVYVELWRGVPSVPSCWEDYEVEEKLNLPFSFADNRAQLGTARNSK